MSAIIKVEGVKATIDDYKWTSKNEELQDFLNSLLDPNGPSGGDPNPDLHAAQAAVQILGSGASLIDYEKLPYVEGRVY